MKELEKLLNSLIQRGWEPWNRKADFCEYRFWKIRFIKESGEIVGLYTIRSLVSIESGLWQFVCDKELVQHKTSEKIIKRYVKEVVEREGWDITEADIICTDLDSEYRLLESALIPEEKLGKFLVDNIRINESLWTAD